MALNESLTQRDIDELMEGGTAASVTSGPTTVAVAPYNFARPPRVSRDRRASLEAIFNRYAASLQGLFMSRLRANMDVELSSVEQATFAEFVLSLPSPCAAFAFKVGDRLGGHGALELGTEVAYHLVDRLFGGAGEACDLSRELTPLEQTVIRGLSERALLLLQDAWQPHVPMAPELLGFESHPEMLRITSEEETVLVIHLKIRAGAFSGVIMLCLPVSTFETFLQEKASSRVLTGPPSGSDLAERRARIESALRLANVNLVARLPLIKLPTRAVADFKIGQVIATGQSVETQVELRINGRLHSIGAIGQVHGHVAVQIQQTTPTTSADSEPRAFEGRML